MSTNLSAVRSAIIKELEYARQGASYYNGLIDTLQQTLANLDSLQSKGQQTTGGQTKRRRVDAMVKVAGNIGKSSRRRSHLSSSEGATPDLPATSREFWLSLFSDRPRSKSEVLQQAINALQITPTAEQLKKLTFRMRTAIHALTQQNVIQAQGTGRGRKYTSV